MRQLRIHCFTLCSLAIIVYMSGLWARVFFGVDVLDEATVITFSLILLAMLRVAVEMLLDRDE